MLKGTVSKILLASALLCSAFSAKAQNTAYNAYTPYSMYGIGDISKQGTSFNKTMGGTGIATRDKKVLNYLNPAAVTAREQKAFMADFSICEGNRYYAQGDYKSCNNTFNIYDFAISFPVWKSLAMYAGFSPYSDVGYDVSSIVTDQDVIGVTGNISRAADGYGGMSGVFVGAGAEIVKGLSIGAEFDYNFGTIDKVYTQSFSNTSYRSVYSGYTMNLKAPTFKFGVQYETPSVKNVSAVIGATYKLAADLRGTINDYEYSTVSSVTDTSRNNTTNLSDNLGAVKLAGELGVGLALRGGDKWTAEVNYLRSDWTDNGFDSFTGFANIGESVFSSTVSQSVRGGFSYVPNRNDIRYYSKRITYRGGAYWDQAYYKFNGNTVNTIGLTFGVTLPIYVRSNGMTLINGVTVGVDAGQRGLKQDNMVRERFINFNIGLNLYDIWFIKQKYN